MQPMQRMATFVMQRPLQDSRIPLTARLEMPLLHRRNPSTNPEREIQATTTQMQWHTEESKRAQQILSSKKDQSCRPSRDKITRP